MDKQYKLKESGDVVMTMLSGLLGFVSQYGLPLVLLFIIGKFAFKKLDQYIETQQRKDNENRQYMVERIEKSEARQEEMTKINRALSETNRTLADRFTVELGKIRSEVSETKNEVSKITTLLKKK